MCPPKHEIVSENICKVLRFDDKYVFAASGYTARFDPCSSSHTLWNVREITKGVYRDGNISSVDDFASKWGTKMKSVLDDDSKISPPSRGSGGTVVAGLFVGHFDLRMIAKVVFLRITNRGLQVSIDDAPLNQKINAMGEDDVINEFLANNTDRAKIWHHRIDNLASDSQVAALAKLTAEFDPTRHVGGKIDSIRITPSGINWLSVKKQCGNK